MTGNILTVELPGDLAARMAAMPDAARSNFTVVALTYVLGDQDLLAAMTEDPNAVAEIGDALREREAAEARGETGIPLDEAWTELDRRAADRRTLGTIAE